MSETYDNKFSFNKLNSNNYGPWSYKMKMLLIREGLWPVVRDVPPEKKDPTWTNSDEKAQATIALAIADSQIIHVVQCITAHEMWNKIKGIHERDNLSNKLYLLRKLYQSRMECSMEDYILQVLELVERLRGIGEEIKEFHVAALLLSGLPEQYNALVTALDTRPDTELTLDYVKAKLLDESIRQNQQTLSRDSGKMTETAFKGKRTTFKNMEKPKQKTQTKNDISCPICSKNHLKEQCYFYKAAKIQKNEAKTASLNSNQSLDDDCCLNTKDKKYPNVYKNVWYIDSGASSHMTNDRQFFNNLKSNKCEIVTANGQTMVAEGIGDGYLLVNTNESGPLKIKVRDVLYVPKLECNLLSVKEMTSKGHIVTFEQNKCEIKLSNGKTIVAILNNLYKLFENKAFIANNPESCGHTCIHSWHRKLGHRNAIQIKELASKKLANGIKLTDCGNKYFCESCIKSKLTRKSFPKYTDKISKNKLDLVVSDVCGPMENITPSGNRYFITFTDDYSRYTTLYLMKNKDQVSEKLEEYLAMLQNQFNRIPKVLRSDGGGEYTGNKTQSILKRYGIQFQCTVPYSPEQNGISERKNRTICESARCMLSDAGLDKKYWGEAVMTSNYLINRLPSNIINKTPFQLWFNNKLPNLKYLVPFGTKALVHVPNEKQTKFSPRAIPGIMVGYSEVSKGYRILDTVTDRIKISRNVKFLHDLTDKTEKNGETTCPLANSELSQEIEVPYVKINPSVSQMKNGDQINLETENDNLENNEHALRRSERSTKGIPPRRLTYVVQENTKKYYEPTSWKDMMKLGEEEKQKWIMAAEDEIASLHGKGTWVLTDLPQEKRPIGCRWIFKVKHDSEGNIDKYKARLVAKGYNQKYGVDYDSTFAPVVKQTTVRILLSIAAQLNLEVQHYDVKTAYLNGELAENIFMIQPEGFKDRENPEMVCKLQKSLYGLKQSGRAWNIKINDVLNKLRFNRSKVDPCLYIKYESSTPLYVLVYVDDLLIAHKDKDIIKSTAESLNIHFEIKKLGNLSNYLGIKIERHKYGFDLSQTQKIEALIEKYGLEEAADAATPIDVAYPNLQTEDDLLDNNEEYRSAIGSLLYLSTTTRPDIAWAVSCLARRVSKPRQKDWKCAKRVIKYLKGTIDMKLNLCTGENEPFSLTGYTDADWAGDVGDRKSTSGYVFFLGKSPISWSTRKQNSVALSSTEAEYMSAAAACQEAIWLRQILNDFGFPQNTPTTIFEDNQGCIMMAKGDQFSARTKHVDIKYHFVKELVNDGTVQFLYCQSEKMTADALTKPVSQQKLMRFRREMGITASGGSMDRLRDYHSLPTTSSSSQ